MAVLAPTPKAMVSAAVNAKTGLFRRVRPANARSRKDIAPPQPSALAPKGYHRCCSLTPTQQKGDHPVVTQFGAIPRMALRPRHRDTSPFNLKGLRKEHR